jgi:hypothetical protein
MTSDEMNAYLAKMQQEQEDDQKEAVRKILNMAAPLMLAGIQVVTYEYEGSGDSGEIQELKAFSDKECDVEVAIPEAYREDLEGSFSFLEPSGYENNDGGYGNMKLICAELRIEHSHDQRIIETEHESFEYTAEDLEG